jgi:hypothetical protein
VTYSNTKEELFCVVIFASYASVPSENNSFPEAAYRHEFFILSANIFIKKVNLDALIEIREVSTALDVSFDALSDCLKRTPDIATQTLFTLRAWRSATTELSDDLVEHK